MLTIGILNVIDSDLRIIFGSIFHLGESDTVELVCDIENAILHHAVQLKIRTNLILAEAVTLGLHLPGIVVVIPWFELEIGTMRISILLHVGNLFINLLNGRSPNLHKQVFGVFDSFSHDWVAGIVGIGFKS